MRKIRSALMVLLLSLLFILSGCDFLTGLFPDNSNPPTVSGIEDIAWLDEGPIISTPLNETESYVVINNNIPAFTEDDYTTESFKYNDPLDSLGRVGVALSSMCFDDMPDYERDDLDTEPTGWIQNRYDTSIVPRGWLYERAHLRGFQFMGDQDDPLNLLTGTEELNNPTMLSFENITADHMKEYRDHHIMYRVTPIFIGDELLARGVVMESDCIECDEEADYAVFVYNRQPGITLDYRTGENWLNTDTPPEEDITIEEATYILNTNSDKFHKIDCSGAPKPDSDNYKLTDKTREELINEGYSPCGTCNP